MFFNEIQQKYLKIKKNLYHTPAGDQTKESLLTFNNIEEEIDLIKYFWYNINNLIENNVLETGYCGKQFFLNYKSDSKKKIVFDNYPITKVNLEKILQTGINYLPILMFFDEDECLTAIECVHTQHTLRTIKDLFVAQKLDKQTFLFIIKPNLNNNNCNVEFILPIELYKKAAYLLNLQTVNYNNQYVKIISKNTVDLWLLFKLYHKEASYYILKNMEFLFDNNYVFDTRSE